MFWEIGSYPRCEHHIFLSHCAADRQWLVHPVFDALQQPPRSIIPWLDRDHYYYGRDSRAALRDGLLRARHVVFFITNGMLDYRRGWCQMELAYSDLVQLNLVRRGGPLLNYELPLFFLDRGHADLPRSVWAALADRGRFHDPSLGDPVAWAVGEIQGFLRREQALARDLAKVVTPGQAMHHELGVCPGLIDRIISFDPSPIP